MDKTHFAQYRNSKIAYHVYGSGTIPIFCLHGFSLSGAAYALLGAQCPLDKIMFALDFPLHGLTEWNEKELTKLDLIHIFEIIHQQEMGTTLHTFELMGHSMGGRICLSMYESYSDRISKLILAAPDGLTRTFGHRFLFKTSLGPKIFRRMSHSSKLIMSLSTTFRKMRIINKSVFTLIKSSYEDTDTAHLIFARLMLTHPFLPNIESIKTLIRKHKTPVFLFFGKYDSIVPAKYGNYLSKGEEQFVKVELLLSGHLILANEETLPQIAKVL
ncbi:MAG: hypothetical protein DI598_02495 [Pseudopedobacter saltans]|uniref:AB hydrolase-1 domain-containing protein n=1 Tax=Pseudopedobacter saltans TaxID=151895 RepID=A0A2W5FBW1_9SPHI|nr:MAG: hypothetical protein DI598_02495 [Pseudopedobacter saltans]